ncbi:methyltransferase, MtaA/CmuA family [Desulfonatronum zhilinae]|nr:methyltransferase, MtaA/CmuA family [Desulfonatronum zhilinae]
MRHSLTRLVFPINALPAAHLIKEGIEGVVRQPRLKLEATERYYRLVDADLIFYFSDIAIQAEALGAGVKYSPGGMPAVNVPAKTIRSPDDEFVERMKGNAFVMRQLSRSFPEKLRAALIYGPFTVAGQVVGEERLLRDLVKDPQGVEQLLRRCCRSACDYFELLLAAGANLLWVSDPLAALIPAQDFERFAGKYLRELFERYRDMPSILHVCGDTTPIIRDIAATGVSGISFDNCMNLLAVEDDVPPETTIIGNIDPVNIVAQADAAQITNSVIDLVSVMGVHDNFSLSTGCAVPPSAPPENVKVFVETGRRAFSDIFPHQKLLREMSRAVYEGREKLVQELIGEAVLAKIPRLTTIRSGLTRAIRKGSACYEVGRCHLPALLIKVDAFYRGLEKLEPDASQGSSDQLKPLVILGTVQDDVHDIGKNLVRIFLESHGFAVLDLGVNVPVKAFLDAFEQNPQALLGLSAFNTNSHFHLAQIIRSFRNKGYNPPFMVGGAAVNAEVARTVGADGFAKDAVRAVELAGRLAVSAAGRSEQA